MRRSLSCLVSFAILFTLSMTAPLERGHGVLRRQSPHRGLSRRIQAALMKRSMNLTFTPVNSGDVSVHVEYGAPTHLRMPDFRFTATLSKLGQDGGIGNVEHTSWGDTQVALRSVDTYGGRHVAISATEPVLWALQQRGVSQDDIPKYVCRNVQVVDPNTGDQYQLVPNNDQEKPVSIDPSSIVLTLNIDQ